MFVLAFAASVVTGLVLAIQSPINASLGSHVGPFQSATTSFTVGTILCAILVLLAGTGDLSRIASVPFWQLTGGAYGVVLVVALLVAIPKLGAALTSCLAMLAQLLVSMVIDAFGLFGASVVSVGPLRFVGCALIAAGILFLLFGSRTAGTAGTAGAAATADAAATANDAAAADVSATAESRGDGSAKGRLFGIALALVAGAFTAIQPPVNAALAISVGTLEASLVSFSVGTALLVVITLVVSKGGIASYKGTRPWHFAGGICGFAAVALPTAFSPVLGMGLWSAVAMFGQLVGSMGLDAFGLVGLRRARVDRFRVAAALLIAAGIVAVALA